MSGSGASRQAVEPALAALGEEVRRGRARVLSAAKVALPAGIGVGALLVPLSSDFPFWIFPPILALGYVLVRWLSVRSAFRAAFKDQVIRALVAGFGDGLSYRPEGSITQAEFDRTGIFGTRPDRFSGEDLIEGRVGATAIRFSEVHAEEKRRRHTKKGTQTYWVTIFRGLFLVADFNKEFRGRTLVLPDTAESLFGGVGRWFQSLSIGRDELVELEDPEFEEQFVVYTTDQIEARYILSTSLMQRIKEYRGRVGGTVYLAFVASELCVAIPTSKDMLEPPSPRHVARMRDDARSRARVEARLEEYVEDLRLALAIVEDLNLNLRIWSKR